MSKKDVFENAKKFVYRNARPLEFARWKYHFENGSAEDVLNILSMYQKGDGGFAYALEPDSWNTNSNPIAVWNATRYLREIGFADAAHPVMKGILNYLDSGKDFADGKWFNTVASNNDFPHAVWWTCDSDTGLPDDNPTVSLAGFALKFSDKNSELYLKAGKIAQKAVTEFIKNPTEEMHTVRCYGELLYYCEEINNFDIFDLEEFRKKIYEVINRVVCKEPEKWYTEYVCKPSVFFEKNHRIFSIIDRELCEKEADMMLNRQLPDGSYPVTWQWCTDYKEFEISANWWRSSIIIDNMIYLKALGRI